MGDDIMYFLSCGANRVLQKPLNITEFENIMSSVSGEEKV